MLLYSAEITLFVLSQRIFALARIEFATLKLQYNQKTSALDLHAFDPCLLG